MELLVEVSVGEVIDKITILEIKDQRITDPGKLANVRAELTTLNETLAGVLKPSAELHRLRKELFDINAALWDIEDEIRECETAKDFGPKFIELARAVYFTNDKRAAVKKQINLAVGSRLVEEKSYAGSL
jgi:hypothetical protein